MELADVSPLPVAKELDEKVPPPPPFKEIVADVLAEAKGALIVGSALVHEDALRLAAGLRLADGGALALSGALGDALLETEGTGEEDGRGLKLAPPKGEKVGAPPLLLGQGEAEEERGAEAVAARKGVGVTDAVASSAVGVNRLVPVGPAALCEKRSDKDPLPLLLDAADELGVALDDALPGEEAVALEALLRETVCWPLPVPNSSEPVAKALAVEHTLPLVVAKSLPDAGPELVGEALLLAVDVPHTPPVGDIAALGVPNAPLLLLAVS